MSFDKQRSNSSSKKNAYRIMVGNLLENVHLEDREGDGRITLRLMLRKYAVWKKLDQNYTE